MNVNQVTLIGRLGKDPEMRYTPNGAAVANFSVATSQYIKKDGGGYDEKTVWVDVTAWGKTAEFIAEYGKKGSQVFVSGRLDTRSWDDKDGKKQFRTFVTALSVQVDKKHGDPDGSDEPSDKPEQQEQPTAAAPTPADDEDDLPF